MSLKFLIMSKFKILTKYLKNTFKSIDLFVSCRSKKWKLLQGIFLMILLNCPEDTFCRTPLDGCFQYEKSVCISDFWKKNLFCIASYVLCEI